MFAALHVPEEQQEAPVHPWPPHCPYRAAQFPPLAGGVGELAGGVVALPPSLLPPPADVPTVIVEEPVLKYYLLEAKPPSAQVQTSGNDLTRGRKQEKFL